MGGACATYGERRDVYKVLVGKPEGKRPLGKPRCRWEGNIKVDMQEVGCWAWTGMIWLRLGKMAGSCKCVNEPSDSIICGEFLVWLRNCQIFRKDSAAWSK